MGRQFFELITREGTIGEFAKRLAAVHG